MGGREGVGLSATLAYTDGNQKDFFVCCDDLTKVSKLGQSCYWVVAQSLAS